MKITRIALHIVNVPERPGLGYTLDHEAVKKYLVQEKVFA